MYRSHVCNLSQQATRDCLAFLGRLMEAWLAELDAGHCEGEGEVSGGVLVTTSTPEGWASQWG